MFSKKEFIGIPLFFDEGMHCDLKGMMLSYVPETVQFHCLKPKIVTPKTSIKEFKDMLAIPEFQTILFFIIQFRHLESEFFKLLENETINRVFRHYRIVVDYYQGPKFQTREKNYCTQELTASKNKAVYIYYQYNAPGAASRRTGEFMNRVMGADLQTKEIPHYTIEELQKIAWSVNREDFNFCEPRKDAISKYPIKFDCAQFPIIL
ncbi:MAG: hypothetical protein LiPW39_199 [Parcubacteria group bacterium LiPW_39]|nr:MAG: hypothetical protein LiPW39_199 [Parcubacteria group bacterium LiPW_39]